MNEIIQKAKYYNTKITAVIVIFALVFLLYPIQATQAASLTVLSDQMSRIKDSNVSNHTITFTTPSGVAAAETIILTFPTGFDVNAGDDLLDFTDVDVTDDAAELGLAATCSGATWGIGVTASAITLTSCTGVIAASSVIVFEIGTNATDTTTGDKQIVNQTVAQNNTDPVIAITGSFGDTGNIGVEIISDDQVVVSTTIDPYITFTLTQNTVSLTKSGGGNPDSTNVGYNNGTANTLAASTNGTSGYTITYSGATLTSGGDTIDAIGGTPATSSTGTEQFGMNLKLNTTPSTGAEPSGGSGTPASDYNTADSFAYETAGTPTLASAAAASATTTYEVSYIANISATTEAGAYTTTITYIATGNF